MRLKHFKRNDVQRSLMGRFQINRAAHSSVDRQQPCSGADTPGVPWFESGEVESGCGRDEVVAHFFCELEKIIGKDAANRVRASVVIVGVAASVSIPSRQRVFRTGLKFRSQDVHAGVHGSRKRDRPMNACSRNVHRRSAWRIRCHHVGRSVGSARPSMTSSSPDRSRITRSSNPPMFWPRMMICGTVLAPPVARANERCTLGSFFRRRSL